MRVRLFALVVLLAGSAAVAQQPDKKDLPKPLPEAEVKAWRDAGAKAGWLRVNEIGYAELTDRREVGSLPGFKFRQWKDGVVVKLPVPDAPFVLLLDNTRVTNAGLKELAELKNLTALDLGSTGVTDAGLKELAPLKNLTALALGHTPVTDIGLKELTPLKSLTTLRVYGTRVTDAGLKELAGLTNLTTLTLANTRVTDAGLKELAGLKSLTTLSLEGPITDARLKTLREVGLLHALPNAEGAGGKRPTKLEDVTALDLGGTRVTDAGLTELAGFKNLTTLELGSTQITDAGLTELAGFKNLTTLQLFGTKVSDAGLKILAGHKNLTCLYLNGTAVTDVGMKELAGLLNLTTLDLGSTAVTNAGLKELAPLKKLNTLDLGGFCTDIRPSAAFTDARLKTLREVGLLHAVPNATAAGGNRPNKPEDVTDFDLTGTAVTDAGLKELAPLKNLTTLKLDEPLTDAGLKALREMGLLHALANAMTADGKRPTKIDGVTALILMNTTVTDAGLKELAPLKNVTVLYLRSSAVTNAGLKELAGLKNLTILWLVGTKVTKGGVAELQKVLPKCKIHGP